MGLESGEDITQENVNERPSPRYFLKSFQLNWQTLHTFVRLMKLLTVRDTGPNVKKFPLEKHLFNSVFDQ